MCCATDPSFLGEAAYVHMIYAAHNERCSPAQQPCRWPRARIIQTLIITSRFSLRCCDTWSRDLFHLAQALTLSRRMFSLPELQQRWGELGSIHGVWQLQNQSLFCGVQFRRKLLWAWKSCPSVSNCKHKHLGLIHLLLL